MDARGIDRATALVCAPPTALAGQLALALADDGYDVHRPAPDVDERAAEEAALVAAVAGRARPLGVAVVDLGDGSARPETLEAVVAVMNGVLDARLVLLVDGRRARVGCEPHVGVLTVVRHPLRSADRDPTAARRLARRVLDAARPGRTRTVREPGRAGRAPLTRPVALRSVTARWSW